MSPIDRVMKSYVANPAAVRAGRIERVHYEEDNEDFPFVVWVDGQHMSLSEAICEDIDPQVGDYLVMPRAEGERAHILPASVFHLFYQPIGGTRTEAAIAAGLPTFN